jgi:hypothetical protein
VVIRLALIGLLAALVVPGVGAAAPGISGADGDVWNAASPTPTYTITASGNSDMEWRLDGGRWTRERSPVAVLTIGPIPDGVHVLRVRDRGGGGDDDDDDDEDDGGGEATRRFRVDTAPPRIGIVEPRPSAVYGRGQVVAARYSCSDAVSCAGPVSAGRPLPTGPVGPASFVVHAVDEAGNAATARVDYAVARAPRPRRAHLLSPAAGRRVRTLRPLLRWRPRAGADVYNVQIFVLEDRARKVFSAFPRGPRMRVPANKLAPDRRYVWRVWPHVAGRYPRQPIGLSFFDVVRRAA